MREVVGERVVSYRCEARSVTGFVQQFACCYVLHGYHHYVVGEIPARKDPCVVDERLIERYGIDLSRFQRARRKKAGSANVQYIRYRRFFVLCATEPKGAHQFYEEHPPRRVGGRSVPQIRDIKQHPLAFGGYSIGYHRGIDRKWHVSVRIHPERYRDLKAHFVNVATKWSVANLEKEFQELRFEPYAPVRRQLLALLRAVNRERKSKGWDLVPFSALRLKRRIVRPFGWPDDVGKEDAA